MRLTRWSGAAGVVFVCAASALATTYTGSLSYNPLTDPTDGLSTSGAGWSTGLRLDWTVDDTSSTHVGYKWHYSYTLSVLNGGQGGLSRFFVEVSGPETGTQAFRSGDIKGLSGARLAEGNPGYWNDKLPLALRDTGDTFLFFEKPFDVSPGPLSWTISFYTNHKPFWGDFFAKDGKAGNGGSGVFNAGWNTSFVDNDPADPPTNGSIQNNILRPDGLQATGDVIPEPLTMFSVFLAIGGLGMYVRKHTRRTAV